MDYKLQLVLVPVSDVDRAKAFYEQVGFHLDVDHRAGDSFRVVQLTPPGSACSISLGIGITDAEPGQARGLHLVVDDIEAARADLTGRGIEVNEIRHMRDGAWSAGVDPEHARLQLVRRLRRPRRQHLGAPGGRLQLLTCDHLVTYYPGMDDDEVFKALADQTRRHLLDRLFEHDGRTLASSRRSWR